MQEHRTLLITGGVQPATKQWGACRTPAYRSERLTCLTPPTKREFRERSSRMHEWDLEVDGSGDNLGELVRGAASRPREHGLPRSWRRFPHYYFLLPRGHLQSIAARDNRNRDILVSERWKDTYRKQLCKWSTSPPAPRTDYRCSDASMKRDAL
ncbi:hypothetical protein SVAN01_11889 [Stagonosporopsis vannaccii]|nr:hypothetical protein SVAN01_11889 [Stagonosporopsis vannaccii]